MISISHIQLRISFVFASLIANDFKSSHPLTKKPLKNDKRREMKEAR